MADADIVYLDDYRLVVCDCCVSPVRRKDTHNVSRKDQQDSAEICNECIAYYFDDDNYDITEITNGKARIGCTSPVA